MNDLRYKGKSTSHDDRRSAMYNRNTWSENGDNGLLLLSIKKCFVSDLVCNHY